MNPSFEDSGSPPASPQKPMLNYRHRLSVDGPVLGILANLTSKVEKALVETTNEIESESRLTKYLSGENRPFVKALYDLEHFIGTTAERSRSNDPFFGSIEACRIKAAWKQVCQAPRHLSLALFRMTQECSMLISIRVCRRYVVRVLRRIAFHFGKLVGAMESQVGRVWIGSFRYGDDMNTGSMLKARIRDWLRIKTRFLDKVLCKGPDHVMRWGERDEFLELEVSSAGGTMGGAAPKTGPAITGLAPANISCAPEPTIGLAWAFPENWGQRLPSAAVGTRFGNFGLRH